MTTDVKTEAKVEEAIAKATALGTIPAIELENHKKDIEFFLKNSTVNAKGDEVSMPQGKFEEWEASHGIERVDLERMHEMCKRADVAKTVTALTLLGDNIKKTIDAGEDASNLSATFRTRDAVFKHSAKATAARQVSEGIVKAGEEVKRKTVYGSLSSTIGFREKLPTDLCEKASTFTKKALGL